jgi:hypothetical protein
LVSLVTDASLAKRVGSQWEGNPFIKNVMLKLDVLVQTTQPQNCVN